MTASRSQAAEELERARGALSAHRAAVGALEDEGSATRHQSEVRSMRWQPAAGAVT